MRKYLRYLRIAFSATCLVACVLLCVLWVRSYWWFDSCDVCFDGKRGHWLGSIAGEIRYGRPDYPAGAHGLRWETCDEAVEQVLASEHPRQSLLGFRWGRCSNGADACPIIPDWFPVLLFAAAAVVPWIRKLKWRFSLRTLLIATMLVAVVLGLIVYATRQ